ncbi:RING-H2 finger protein ATL1 [Ananas comosus]|uniref:RING-type E3 ubiquitin transferase n=1 Tax=Ananas comosus TaxID=4615 RepID=A0A199VGN8_ANACO|nr:RING-H2 finger protein ATL1 [Ananas comosus]
MDPKRIHHHLPKPSQLPLPPPPPPPPPPPSSPQHSPSSTSFPILALSILGILTTSILLLSYYIFVIKCCLNWRHSDVITRLSSSRIPRRRRRSRPRDYPPAAYSAPVESRGLDESAIRSLPTFRYRKAGDSTSTANTNTNTNDCAVCLNEFQEEERIRLLPNCLHLFHIDCIDTWLQSNANCPLCRSPITAILHPMLAAAAAAAATQLTEPGNGRDPGQRDDAAAIEVAISGESRERSHPGAAVASPRKGEELGGLKRGKRPHNGGSMGDECIEVRSKDETFCIQPMRRSFSMDSSSDNQLYLALQRILQKSPHFQDICGSGSGESSSSSSSSGSGRARRPFFSFGSHRSSRSAVLPI